MEILRAENLVKTYGTGSNTIRALDGVTFSIENGEFVSIVGTSGSGKSTLIHILGGVDEPDSGKVYMNGQDVFARSRSQLAIFRRRQVGIIYQFNNLIPQMTVKENIQLPALLEGRKVEENFYQEILGQLELEGRENDLPDMLSGGQQQRVAIGRTLINNPQVILADEPTGNLDMRNTQKIINLFKHINKWFKRTIVLITHDQEIALQTDRILTIENGRIERDVPTVGGRA
ncbi:MAG: ABC transporter ATP-binding protein [Clostridia bacterium]|nr:ABC transporter ATP-binding protein [Clostridia bacterium]